MYPIDAKNLTGTMTLEAAAPRGMPGALFKNKADSQLNVITSNSDINSGMILKPRRNFGVLGSTIMNHSSRNQQQMEDGMSNRGGKRASTLITSKRFASPT